MWLDYGLHIVILSNKFLTIVKRSTAIKYYHLMWHSYLIIFVLSFKIKCLFVEKDSQRNEFECSLWKSWNIAFVLGWTHRANNVPVMLLVENSFTSRHATVNTQSAGVIISKARCAGVWLFRWWHMLNKDTREKSTIFSYSNSFCRDDGCNA